MKSVDMKMRECRLVPMPLRRVLLLIPFVIPSLFAQKSNPPAVSAVRPPAVAPVGCDPNKFLARACQDLLGRPIDPSSSAYWLGAMKNGMNRTQVASQMLHSSECTAARVRALYAQYLHRPPSGGEVSTFSQMLQQGANSDQVDATIVASPEYYNSRGGGTNAGFVSAMYQDVLGRPADPPAFAMFTQQLGSGSSRAQVAQQVLASNEAHQRRINALYNRYLHHPASGPVPGGSLDQVAASIIGSEEYCRR
jgi:hypothetical protein